MNRYTVILTPQPNGADYIATCPEVPEISATGLTPHDALLNWEHTYELVAKARDDMKIPLPEPRLDWTSVTVNADTMEVEVKCNEEIIAARIDDML